MHGVWLHCAAFALTRLELHRESFSPGVATSMAASTEYNRGVLLAVLVTCWLQTLGSCQGLGWIILGSTGLPTCSYCLNVLNANSYPTYVGLQVTIFRCLKFDRNEQWAVDNATNTISLHDPANKTLCVEAGFQSDYNGGNVTLLPLHLSACDGSAKQQWFFDSAARTVRSGIKGSDGGPLYMVAGNLSSQDTAAYYNLYLSTLQVPGVVSSQLTFLPASSLWNDTSDFFLNMRSADPVPKPGNLIDNGGFERTTVLGSWPAGVNCSQFTTPCSKTVFFNYELFSLCSWAIEKPPLQAIWIHNRAPVWTAAEGNSSLLLTNGLTINQSFPTEPDSMYLLSFSLAGYVSPAVATDTYVRCFNQSGYVTVTTDGPKFWSFEVDQPSPEGITLWFNKTLAFTSSGSATAISFTSVGFSGTCGAVIDAVRVTTYIPPPSSHSHKKVVGATVGSSLFVALVLFVALPLVLWRQRMSRPEVCLDPHAVHNVRIFSYSEIQKATAGWSTVIGEGGFSTVYKAEFSDGLVGAVKVEKHRPLKLSLFVQEVTLLQQVHHRNLVNLLGFCATRGHRVLVFEYLPNKTLYQRLHPREKDEEDNAMLPWDTRMKIIYEVACALEYLHHGTSPPVVHRDIKSANILLTATDSAKLADFGLSKAAPPGATSFQSVNTLVRGSLGYLDPKYVRTGVYSPKSDVYSFGVVVLETVSGYPAIKDMDLLSYWAADCLSDPFRASEIVDKRLCGELDDADLHILIDLVKMCLQEDSDLRPTMQQVLSFLADSHFSGFPSPQMAPIPDALPRTPSSIETPVKYAYSSSMSFSSSS